MEAIRLVRLESPLPNRRREFRAAAVFDVRPLLRPLAYALAIAIAAAGGLLLSQRLLGVLSTPLGAAALVATGFLSTCWAALAHLMLHYTRRSPSRSWHEKTIDWLPTAGLAMIAAAVSLPGSPSAAILLVWALIAAEEYLASFIERRGRTARPARRSVQHRPARMRAPGDRWPRVERFTDAPSIDVETSSITDSIRQQFVRKRTAKGEIIRGTLRMAIEQGQRLAVAHLVFCPTLADIPAIDAELNSDIDGSVRATHVFRYGARLEIKLSEPCEAPAEVLVGYHVQSPPGGA